MRIPSNIKAVIFDLDGLLIDSEPAWVKANTKFLGNKGHTYTQELYKRIRGAGHKEVAEIFKSEFLLEGNTRSIINEMRSYFYKVFSENPKLAAGSISILKSAKKKGYALSIATGNGPRSEVLKMLGSLRIKKYFPIVITGDEIKKGKPSPDIYIFTAKKLKMKPSDCLVLEDAVNGVIAGKKASMKVFGVNKDEKIREDLKKIGADEVFFSLTEIKL